MAMDEDTEWLRRRLNEPSFQELNNLNWIAVKDRAIVHRAESRSALESWLKPNDPNNLCILAFCDDRVFV